MAELTLRAEIGRNKRRAALPQRDAVGESQWGRGTRSSGQSEQGHAPTYLMRAAKQPFGRLLAVERTSVREGTDDAPQQQKLEHEAGHLDQGRGGLSGTGYSGFARR